MSLQFSQGHVNGVFTVGDTGSLVQQVHAGDTVSLSVIFHGGIENQRILPMGTVEEVKEETRMCLDTLGKGGGYICCSCHNAQAGTPVENILAMIETVKG